MSAEAFAASTASTELRINVIVTQINYLVRETTGSTRIQQVLELGMIQKKCIAAVVVQAYDDQNRIWAEIEARVDWERHKVNLRRHGETVMIDKSLPVGEQVSWAIGEIARWFKGYSQKSQLQVGWTIRYTPEIEADRELRDQTTSYLGLVYGPGKTWIEGLEIVDVLCENPEQVDELTSTLRAAM